jgi:hypothetical protein
MTINWNDRVTVRPNALGWRQYDEFYRALGMEPPAHGETFRQELWSVAQIWGKHLYNGCQPPFVTMDFEIELDALSRRTRAAIGADDEV